MASRTVRLDVRQGWVTDHTCAAETTRVGYDRLLERANQQTQTACRVWSVEGTGSYGAGVSSHLSAAGEWVIEFNHPTPSVDGAKTDALDARRAARQVLGCSRLSTPRVRGDREALRVLETTRRGAQTARTSAINELKALIVTAPVDLRDQLRDLTTASLVAKCRRFRLASAPVNEHTATKQAMRFASRRIHAHHRSSRPGNNHHRTGPEGAVSPVWHFSLLCWFLCSSSPPSSLEAIQAGAGGRLHDWIPTTHIHHSVLGRAVLLRG